MIILVKKPIITEKSMRLAKAGLYTFAVAKAADKLQIAKFISEKFKVDVLSVKIVNTKGENKLQRRVRKFYQASTAKKAIVEVKKGQKIGIFEAETVQEPEVTRAENENIVKEQKSFLKGTKVRVERGGDVAQTTQRKVITGK